MNGSSSSGRSASVDQRVPFDGLAHAGEGANDDRVEAASDVAFPVKTGLDVGLHGGVAVGLSDPRVAARQQGRLRRDPLGGDLHRDDATGAMDAGCAGMAVLSCGRE